MKNNFTSIDVSDKFQEWILVAAAHVHIRFV
jgi:hypothetical protein